MRILALNQCPQLLLAKVYRLFGELVEQLLYGCDKIRVKNGNVLNHRL